MSFPKAVNFVKYSAWLFPAFQFNKFKSIYFLTNIQFSLIFFKSKKNLRTKFPVLTPKSIKRKKKKQSRLNAAQN